MSAKVIPIAGNQNKRQKELEITNSKDLHIESEEEIPAAIDAILERIDKKEKERPARLRALRDCLESAHATKKPDKQDQELKTCLNQISIELNEDSHPVYYFLRALARIAQKKKLLLGGETDGDVKDLMEETARDLQNLQESIDEFVRSKTEYDQSLREVFNFIEYNSFLLMVYLLRNWTQLEKKNERLLKLNSELEDTANRMVQLTDEYRHTVVKNIKPDRIKSILDAFKKKAVNQPDLKTAWLGLDDVYRDEAYILRESDVLRFRYKKPSNEDFQYIFQTSSVEAGSQVDEVVTTPVFIWEEALRRVTKLFLTSPYSFWDEARKKLLDKKHLKPYKLANISDDFRNCLLLGDSCASKWVNENLFEIRAEFSPKWREVRLQRNSYAETLLYNYFHELWLNYYKYSDLTYVISHFYEESINGKTYLSTEWKNCYSNNNSVSTRKGLESIRFDLQALNGTKTEEESLVIEDNERESVFSVRLVFREYLLLVPPLPLPEEIG